MSSLEEVLQNNRELFKSYFGELEEAFGKPDQIDGSYLWNNANKEHVVDFIERFRFHKEIQNLKESLIGYINRNWPDDNDGWDIAYIGLKTSKPSSPEMIVSAQERTASQRRPSEPGWYVGDKQKVSGTGVEKIGLTDEQIKAAEQEAGSKTVTDRHYRAARQKPLLMLHLLKMVTNHDTSIEEPETIKDVPAISVSFPYSSDSKPVEYVVNKVWIQKDMFDSADEEEDYDD